MDHGLELIIPTLPLFSVILEILESLVFSMFSYPVNIGKRFFPIFSYPENIGKLIFHIFYHPGNIW